MRPRFYSVAAIVSPLPLAIVLGSHALDRLTVAEYSPRRALYLAHPWLLWTNVLSDVLIAISYALFFYGLCWLMKRLREIAELRTYLWVLGALRIFILASGATVLIRIVTVWWPMYQVSIILKIVCAIAATPAAVIFAFQSPAMANSILRFFEVLSTDQFQSDRLRKSEEFLDRTGRLAGIGGWEIDLTTDEVTWSAETCRIHGAPPDYKPTLAEGIETYAPEARPTAIAAVLTASAGGDGWDLELPVIRRDGRRIWTRSVGVVEYNEGKPVRLVGALQDVTAIVEAREALRKATERVTLATNSGGIGIWDWDIVNQTLICDPWMFRLHGKDPKDPPRPGELWRDHLHPEDREFVEQALADAVDGVEDYDAEFRVIWEDGSVHHIRGTASVTRDEAGRPVRMVGANWEVTEARRLTTELADQHELLRVTLQSIGDGVITKDPDRKVLWMNTVAERMTGWSTADALGRSIDDVFRAVNEAGRAPITTVFTDLSDRTSTVTRTQQALLISNDGTERFIETSATPLRNDTGKLHGNIIVFRDVTEQRHLAAETERVNKLQLELKTKDEFLSHVSHELRSPLTSIYSFSSIIADDLAGETSPEQKEYLTIILKNVTQLQAMIEDLLTVTQSREGKLSVDLQSVSAAEAVADALHTLQGPAAAKQINLSACDCSELPPACADPTRLRQVLIILLDNAIKFTPEGGSIRVDAREKETGFLIIQVSDSGCGIPPEMQARVFDKLYQITGPNQPDTSQAGRTGLGLGLHIARNLVTRQGGHIWVTSTPGKGSVFSFTLPIFATADDLSGSTPRRRKTDKPLPSLISAA